MWDDKIKIGIFGESHGKAIGVTVEGLPCGFEVDFERLRTDMKRRSPKSDGISTSRKETDEFTIISGIYNGKTTGAPLCAIINNNDVQSDCYDEIKHTPRPGHADYASFVKYNGFADLRGAGHLSGRLTAPLVLAGSICKQMLKAQGIEIYSHIYSIGSIKDSPLDTLKAHKEIYNSLNEIGFPAIDKSVGEKMQNLIRETKTRGDSVGGIVECGIYGIPAGKGDPIFNGVESIIAGMLFSVPGVKGVEFGAGFGAANLRGSDNNDEYFFDENDSMKIKTKTNNSGGIAGGITNGMPIICRAAIKPTPSIAKKQNTVNLKEKKNCEIEVTGRHDACIVPRACAVIECACAAAVLDIILR